jgi:hypothetical protein
MTNMFKTAPAAIAKEAAVTFLDRVSGLATAGRFPGSVTR